MQTVIREIQTTDESQVICKALHDDEESQVQCLLTKKLASDDDEVVQDESISRQHVYMSPETPAQSSAMKRVFASTEYKVLGYATLGGGAERRPVEDEVKVAYRLPGIHQI